MSREKIKVLIVDDSAVVRQTLSTIYGSDPAIDVIGAANDPFQAAEMLKRELPDVISLDVEMPRMDGLTFMRKIMAQRPIPIVICSTLVGEGSETAIKALEYGAVDIFLKPKLGTKQALEEARIHLCDIIKAASYARVSNLLATVGKTPSPKHSADAVLTAPSKAMAETTEKIVAIGASTGGTEALRVVLSELPYDTPGTLVVQHMPAGFTATFAQRLNEECKVSVKEAKDGDSVLPGTVLIAPGNFHMLLRRSGARYFVEVKEGELVCRHRPSVDVLFRSVAAFAGTNAIGVIMTGMGDDGARGLKEMRDQGAKTIAQDESTSVVFGMPQEAIKLGAAEKVLPLQSIAKGMLGAAWGKPAS